MTTNYTGIKLGDETGWAPTPDTFPYNKNRCVEGNPQFFKEDPIITNLPDGNEAAINALKDGTIDALYIYADQMNNFIQSGNALATGLGTDFAYIQTGLDQFSYNGTTLAISKRGSGLAEVFNPCIDKVLRTQAYRDVCESFFDPSSCIGSDESGTTLFYDVAMNERTDTFTCADGYCTCAGV
mmetsp:Transcript_33624/g.70768  ORF Transcript_33624/g.70768 Transcript_33624/m.70768 type:complete len:183 (-) Transcript_33624:233-781(-)